MKCLVCSVDEAESEHGYYDLTDSSYQKWTDTLFAEIPDAGPQTYAGKGEEERPAR